HRQINKQVQVASESSLPSQLAKSRQIADNFDRDGGPKGKADRNPGQRWKLCSRQGQNMPNKHAGMAQTLGTSCPHVRQGGASYQQVAAIAKDDGENDESNDEA